MKSSGGPQTQRLRRPRASGTSGTRACDRLKLCQAHVKLLGSDRNAVKELIDLPSMTSWAYNVLMGHRNEITGYKVSKVDDTRLDRWISVVHSKQSFGR